MPEKIAIPKLPLRIAASIEAQQNHLDEVYWLQLMELRVENEPDSSDIAAALRQAKKPAMLMTMLADYARNLYIAEGNLYPDDPRIRQWLENLRDRIVERAMDTVEKMEESGKKRNISFKYHGVSHEQMRTVMLEEIDSQITARLGPIQPQQNAKLTDAHGQPETKDFQASESKPETFGDQLKRLLNEARIRPEDIAEEIGIEARNVYRHLAGTTAPTLVNLGKYERALSKHLGRPVRFASAEPQNVRKTSSKRQ